MIRFPDISRNEINLYQLFDRLLCDKNNQSIFEYSDFTQLSGK